MESRRGEELGSLMKSVTSQVIQGLKGRLKEEEIGGREHRWEPVQDNSSMPESGATGKMGGKWSEILPSLVMIWMRGWRKQG